MDGGAVLMDGGAVLGSRVSWLRFARFGSWGAFCMHHWGGWSRHWGQSRFGGGLGEEIGLIPLRAVKEPILIEVKSVEYSISGILDRRHWDHLGGHLGGRGGAHMLAH